MATSPPATTAPSSSPAATQSATLLANFTFASGNAGTHNFTITLKTPGTQTINVTDAMMSSIAGSASANGELRHGGRAIGESGHHDRGQLALRLRHAGLRHRQRAVSLPSYATVTSSAERQPTRGPQPRPILEPCRLPAAAIASPPRGTPAPASRSPSISWTVKRTTSPSTRSTMTIWDVASRSRSRAQPPARSWIPRRSPISPAGSISNGRRLGMGSSPSRSAYRS